MKIRVTTISVATGAQIGESRVVEYGKRHTRQWLEKHQYWAFNSGYGVVVNCVDDEADDSNNAPRSFPKPSSGDLAMTIGMMFYPGWIGKELDADPSIGNAYLLSDVRRLLDETLPKGMTPAGYLTYDESGQDEEFMRLPLTEADFAAGCSQKRVYFYNPGERK